MQKHRSKDRSPAKPSRTKNEQRVACAPHAGPELHDLLDILNMGITESGGYVEQKRAAESSNPQVCRRRLRHRPPEMRSNKLQASDVGGQGEADCGIEHQATRDMWRSCSPCVPENYPLRTPSSEVTQAFPRCPKLLQEPRSKPHLANSGRLGPCFGHDVRPSLDR